MVNCAITFLWLKSLLLFQSLSSNAFLQSLSLSSFKAFLINFDRAGNKINVKYVIYISAGNEEFLRYLIDFEMAIVKD